MGDRIPTIAVIGLGYVGLPLAVAFAAEYPTIGFDIDPRRVDELKRGHDRTLEVSDEELSNARDVLFSSDSDDLRKADVYVVTVPTPVDSHKRPDLRPLIAASRTVGAAMRTGATVVYESTVYPGATEEVCVPILAAESGMTLNEDFTVGYSPERINPGDHARRLPDIVKVTSGSTPRAAELIDTLYSRIITAGTHRAPSIKVAEAAKVIENTQRDVNIALINELAILFGRLGIDTNAVLEAAGTKWNFLPFRPGLVGGHCIGVDPYYLTYKAEEVGYQPEVILAGRRMNDGMGDYVADQVVLLMARAGLPIAKSRALVLGLTFKENVPDLRNTRVIDVIQRLAEFGVEVHVADPWADPSEAMAEYGIELVSVSTDAQYEAVVLAVAHDEYSPANFDPRSKLAPQGVLYDVKGTLPPATVHGRL